MIVVADVMTTDVRTLGPTATIGHLRDVLYLSRIGSVPIVDDEGGLVGIVTSSDVVEDWSRDQLVSNLMNLEVTTVAPSTTVSAAARLMRDRAMHHLVVSDDGTTVDGILSSWDLLVVMADVIESSLADTVPVRRAAPGDGLVFQPVGQPGGRRATIREVHGDEGRLPFVMTWDDEPDAESIEVTIVHHGEIPLDGCER